MESIYLPKLTPINRGIIIISAVIFILNAILSMSGIGVNLFSMASLSVLGMGSGLVHTLITYPLISQGFFEILLNSLMLWLMGSEFEVLWGQKRYLTFLASATIGGGIIFLLISGFLFHRALVGFPLSGLSGLVSSLCMAYAIIFPDRIFSFMMIIPVKAKYFGWLLALVSLYQGLRGPMGAGSWGHLGSLLSAYLFMVYISRSKVKKVKKSKANLKIVANSEDESQSSKPKYWH